MNVDQGVKRPLTHRQIAKLKRREQAAEKKKEKKKNNNKKSKSSSSSSSSSSSILQSPVLLDSAELIQEQLNTPVDAELPIAVLVPLATACSLLQMNSTNSIDPISNDAEASVHRQHCCSITTTTTRHHRHPIDIQHTHTQKKYIRTVPTSRMGLFPRQNVLLRNQDQSKKMSQHLYKNVEKKHVQHISKKRKHEAEV
jgi:hypothetical protein